MYRLGFFTGASDLEIATFLVVVIILIVGVYPLFRR